MDSTAAIVSSETGVRFAVRLTPRGGRDGIDGWATGSDGRWHLKARVAVPPESGKANTALIALMAKTLLVPKSKVRIVSGEKARLKQLDVSGVPAYLLTRLEGLGEGR